MILYSSSTSPYVRKVRIVLIETNQVDAVEEVASSTKPMDPLAGLSAKNPLMKIPALERPSGPTLYDSRVICQFLDARVDGGLYRSGDARWDSLTLEATGDGILDAALLMTYENRLRLPDMRWELWLDAQWSKIDAACDALETRWMSHLKGPLDIGKIAVSCALGYVDFRHGARNWRAGRDALAAWYDDFAKRPSFVATEPVE